MSPLRRILVIAPCEGLADFPTYLQGADAAGLLAAWTTAWTPRLVAAAGRTPEILSSYDLPEDDGPEAAEIEPTFADTLAFVPGCVAADEAVRRGVDRARLELGDRVGFVESFGDRAAIISLLRESPWAPHTSPCDGFDAEFAAFGYARLQVALLTGGLLDSDGHDPRALEAHAVAAAVAAVAGDQAAFDASLRSAYDQLETLRNNAYPIESWLLDLVLVAETTLGPRLEQEVAEPTPKTLRLTEKLAERVAGSAGSANGLRAAVAEERIAITLGDEVNGDTPTPWSRLPPESMADAIDAASDAIEAATGRPPTCCSPWSARPPARLIQALAHRGFRGLTLAGYDNGPAPFSENTKASVATPEGETLPALARRPLDLAAPETYLRWADRLTETLQNDPTPTLLLAGWAGGRHEMLDLLQRVARRSPVLGEFVTLDRYFDETAPAERDATPAAELLGPAADDRSTGAASPPPDTDRHLLAGLALIAGADERLAPAEALAERINGRLADDTTEDGQPLAINPWSFACTAADGANRRTSVPGCGFAQLSDPAAPTATRAEPLVLQNQHGRVEADPSSGGVRSLWTPGVRGPLLSQRLVVGSRSDLRGWVAMHADENDDNNRGDERSPSAAEIVTTGELRSTRGAPLARFRQTVSFDASGRGLIARVKLEPLADAAGQRWFAFRLMLRDDDWQAWRTVQWRRLADNGYGDAAADVYELRAGGRLVSLSGDTPLRVRRQGERGVDAVLADGLSGPLVAEFAIGFAEPRPLQAKLAREAPPLIAGRPAGATGPDEGWWLHIDTPSVVVSRIEPLPVAADSDAAGRARVHLIETAGRAATTNLRLWRPLRSARSVGDGSAPLPITADGAARIGVPAHGWLRIEVSW